MVVITCNPITYTCIYIVGLAYSGNGHQNKASSYTQVNAVSCRHLVCDWTHDITNTTLEARLVWNRHWAPAAVREGLFSPEKTGINMLIIPLTIVVVCKASDKDTRCILSGNCAIKPSLLCTRADHGSMWKQCRGERLDELVVINARC